MSGYYAQVSNISGSKSCVATSAYMSREKMKDEQMNHTFNYSAHEHDHTFSNVTLCKNAPEEWQDKEKLWNAVEEAEKGKQKCSGPRSLLKGGDRGPSFCAVTAPFL